jgi:hypothetical protein
VYRRITGGEEIVGMRYRRDRGVKKRSEIMERQKEIQREETDGK